MKLLLFISDINLWRVKVFRSVYILWVLNVDSRTKKIPARVARLAGIFSSVLRVASSRSLDTH